MFQCTSHQIILFFLCTLPVFYFPSMVFRPDCIVDRCTHLNCRPSFCIFLLNFCIFYQLKQIFVSFSHKIIYTYLRILAPGRRFGVFASQNKKCKTRRQNSSAPAAAVAFCFAKQGGKIPLLLQQQSHFASQNKEELWILLVLSGRCFRR